MLHILTFFLIFTIYIFLYNLAMYIPAKLYGVRVEKFYVWYASGFAIFKIKIKETEFGLGWLPLGGYIKLSGMLVKEGEEILPHYFERLSLFRQLVVMFCGPFSSLILGLLVYSYFFEIPFSSMMGIAVVLFVIILTFYLFFRWRGSFLQKNKEKHQTTKIALYLLSLGLYLGLLLVFGRYLNTVFPLSDCIRYIYSGTINPSLAEIYATQGLELLAAGIGIMFFFLNLLPLGSFIGFNIVNNMYRALTGEKVADKFVQNVSLISFPIILFLYAWLIYHLIV